MTKTSSGFTLVTGGARAGKSRYALSLMDPDRPVTYVATAEALDEDMRRRIARHQAERPPSWRTVEAPVELADAVAAAPPDDALIIDCVTIWVSNLLLRLPIEAEIRGPWYPEEETRALATALASRGAPVVAVTNEVGLGIVPATPLGRSYRDALGRVNQHLAAVAARVILVVAGIPIVVKPTPVGA